MRAEKSIQGGHEVLNLATGEVISQRKFTALPMSLHIIKTVNKIAASQGSHTFKITSKTGVILYDATFRNQTDEGTPFVDLLVAKGILPIIKVDKSTVPMTNVPGAPRFRSGDTRAHAPELGEHTESILESLRVRTSRE